MNIMMKLKNFTYLYKTEGLGFTLRNVAYRLKYKRSTDFKIEQRRLQIASRLEREFNSTIAYGPFRGLRLRPDNWWGIDRSGKLLGLYEHEILQSLVSIRKDYRTFVDLGAADGYYGIGVLVSNLFDHSICFEQSKKGREVIRRAAALNGVSDKIEIHGTADANFFDLMPSEARSRSVILIDIEGGEFDLLSPGVLSTLRGCIIFLELHPRSFEDGEEKLSKLRDTASEHFRITEITTGPRDPSQFRELEEFTDTDRWLVCSEGRPFLMHWWKLEPK